jgi:hypothetical protein
VPLLGESQVQQIVAGHGHPMAATLDTRKPVNKLTVGDLRDFPVWEYAIDEEGDGILDETWVRPVDCKTVRKGAYSQIVATDFITPADRKLQGFMIVTTAKGRVEISAGAVVGRVGYLPLPTISRKLAARRKADWHSELRDALLMSLREKEADVFPMRYLLRVLIRRERQPRRGIIR